MLSPQSLFKGLVSRFLPYGAQDGPESERVARFGRYGEPNMLSMVRKAHLLADEGSYFTVNNNQTGILEGTQQSFAATHPTVLIANTDNPASPLAKSTYLDYADLTISAAGVTATAVSAKWAAIVLDTTNRYTSGGTNLTANIVSPNMNAPSKSVTQVYVGALTATAATANARTIVGQRLIRMPVTATTAPDLIGDRLRFEFGGVEEEATVMTGTTGALMANVIQTILKAQPIIIGPGQSCLIYTWTASTTYSTGTTWLPDISFWER